MQMSQSLLLKQPEFPENLRLINFMSDYSQKEPQPFSTIGSVNKINKKT